MKIIAIIFLPMLFVLPNKIWGQDSTKTEKAIKAVPLITSSPLMGFGFGFAVSGLYSTDSGISSKSQLQVGGQYSNTKSYSTFIRNNAWFKGNNILSSTQIVRSGINNEFTSEGSDVAYNVNTFAISELLMFRVAKNVYLGGPLSYKGIKYDANNDGGEDFLERNGIVDEKTGAFGIATSYDTRKNKYFPSSASWLSLKFNANPAWLGTLDSYCSFIIAYMIADS